MSCCNSNSKKSESSCCEPAKGCCILGLLVRWAVIALGVYVAAHTSKGIAYDNEQTLAVVVVVLSLLNLFVKPLLVLFTLPFVVMSFGLGLWLINAGLLMLTAKLVSGFMVESFTSALWGSLVISALSLLVHILSHKAKKGCGCGPNCQCASGQSCVIDIDKDDDSGSCCR